MTTPFLSLLTLRRIRNWRPLNAMMSTRTWSKNTRTTPHLFIRTETMKRNLVSGTGPLLSCTVTHSHLFLHELDLTEGSKIFIWMEISSLHFPILFLWSDPWRFQNLFHLTSPHLFSSQNLNIANNALDFLPSPWDTLSSSQVVNGVITVPKESAQHLKITILGNNKIWKT